MDGSRKTGTQARPRRVAEMTTIIGKQSYGPNGHRDAPRFRLDPAALKRMRDAHADGVPSKELARRFKISANDIPKYVRCER